MLAKNIVSRKADGQILSTLIPTPSANIAFDELAVPPPNHVFRGHYDYLCLGDAEYNIWFLQGGVASCLSATEIKIKAQQLMKARILIGNGFSLQAGGQVRITSPAYRHGTI
jgi:hypothetical protein